MMSATEASAATRERDSGLEENIHVAVRVRPLNPSDVGPVWRVLEERTIISELEMAEPAPKPPKQKPAASRVLPSSTPRRGSGSPGEPGSGYSSPYSPGKLTKALRTYSFTFDHLFGPHVSTVDIYRRVTSSIVWSAMEGINGTVFAYGQTASGKTYTMKGLGKKNPGLIPLSVQDVFSFIKQSPDREFLLRVSYLEIYNEIINDLLAPESVNLRIREDAARKTVWVDGLKEEIVVTPQQVMNLIAGGEAHRHIGATDWNEVSSRSHTIFRLIIESKEIGAGPGAAVRVSALNLIDLAGSERASESLDRRKEGGYINKSLLTLGNVISKLSEKKADRLHVPYRDSKLTRILEPSLSGHARIAIIATASAAAADFEETLSTLKFASRAKQVTNRAQINEILDEKALIQKYRNEIDELKKKLATAEESEKKYKEMQTLQEQKQLVEQHNETLVRKLLEHETLRSELEEKIRHLTRLILVSDSIDPAAVAATSSSTSSFSTPSSPTLGGAPARRALLAGGAVNGRSALTTSADGALHPPRPPLPTSLSPMAGAAAAAQSSGDALALSASLRECLVLLELYDSKTRELEAENTALRERLAYYEGIDEEAAALEAEEGEQPAYDEGENGEEAHETYGEETQGQECDETPGHDNGGVVTY